MATIAKSISTVATEVSPTIVKATTANIDSAARIAGDAGVIAKGSVKNIASNLSNFFRPNMLQGLSPDELSKILRQSDNVANLATKTDDIAELASKTDDIAELTKQATTLENAVPRTFAQRAAGAVRTGISALPAVLFGGFAAMTGIQLANLDAEQKKRNDEQQMEEQKQKEIDEKISMEYKITKITNYNSGQSEVQFEPPIYMCNTDKIQVSNSENIENKEFVVDQVLHSGIILLTTGILSNITGNLGTFKIISSQICNIESLESKNANENNVNVNNNNNLNNNFSDKLLGINNSNLLNNTNIMIISIVLLFLLFLKFII